MIVQYCVYYQRKSEVVIPRIVRPKYGLALLTALYCSLYPGNPVPREGARRILHGRTRLS